MGPAPPEADGLPPPVEVRPGGAGGHPSGLVPRAVRSTSWSLAAQGMQTVIGVLSFALLSRWLSPSDYGRFGLATVATGVLGVVADIGLTGALIRRPAVDDAALATAFWLAQLGALVLTVACALAVTPLGWFLADASIPRLGVAMAALFVALAPGRVATACLTRELRFRTLAVVATAAALLGMTAALVAARRGLGPWALVIQTLGTAVASSLLLVLVRPTPIRRALWSPDIARELTRFGSQLSGFQLAVTLAHLPEALLLGHAFGQGPVGLMTMAQRLTLVPVQRVCMGVSAVFLPAVSTLEAREARGHALARAVGTLALGVVPACVGLFALAGEVVAFLPARWASLAPALRLFALAGLIEPVTYLSIAVATAGGHGPALLRCAAVLVPLWWGAAAVGVLTGSGTGFFACWSVANVVAGTLLWRLARHDAPAAATLAGAYAWPLALSVLMLLPVRGVLAVLQVQGTRAGLAIGVATGVVTYAALSWGLRREATRRAVRLLRPARPPA